jgi:hypothetical protein
MFLRTDRRILVDHALGIGDDRRFLFLAPGVFLGQLSRRDRAPGR